MAGIDGDGAYPERRIEELEAENGALMRNLQRRSEQLVALKRSYDEHAARTVKLTSALRELADADEGDGWTMNGVRWKARQALEGRPE